MKRRQMRGASRDREKSLSAHKEAGWRVYDGAAQRSQVTELRRKRLTEAPSLFHVPLPLGERLGEGCLRQDEDTTRRAREPRRDNSRAERRVWELLRDRRLTGVKFRRQHPIGPYFADFACISRKLVIEIDGDHHAFQVEADVRRTAAMEREGWRVLRFWANYVVQNPEGIWTEIALVLGDGGQPPHPASPPRGRGA